jgi:CHAT domain-containing protein
VLTVYTRDTFPQDWAETQNNLANAYSNRIRGDRADNIERAIATYSNVLTVYTRDTFPQDWAETQNNLAMPYINRIRGDRAENIEQAISCCQAALLVRTQQAFPQDWAETQNNLANAYSNRIRGDRAENIEQAISCYQAALLVRTQQAFPYKNAETLFNLGMLYENAGKFNSAYNTYESAITTVELLLDEIISGEESKRKQAEKWNRLYRNMVEVCLQLGEETLALEFIERSKNRNLVELIFERDSKIIFPPEVVNQLETLRGEIATGQDKIQNGKAENPTVLAQHLKDLRQRKKSLEDEYLPVGSGFNFNKFQATLDKNTAVIEWYITSTGLETFIITSDNIKRFNSSISTDTLQALINSSAKYLDAYYTNKAEWINNLASYLTQLAEILNIEEILKLTPKNFSNLILIPHRYLHLFPVHALPLSDGSFLCNKFPDGVSYAPSCQLLQQVNLRKQVNFNSLFAIQNPTEDLAFTDLEVEIISSLFADKEILSKQQATKTALYQSLSQIQQANYLHFSCHGTFNLKTPQNSCLILAGAFENNQLDLNKCLTVGNLFEQDFNLNQCRLVVLSACETGLIDFNNESDEYIGFPSGFLYAGCSSIVSSLWTPDDVSTSFLMIKFIQILKNIGNISVPVALNQAQNWLRNATKEDLQEWIGNLPLNNPRHKRQLTVFLRRIQANSKPFQSPFYWAAFTAVGN